MIRELKHKELSEVSGGWNWSGSGFANNTASVRAISGQSEHAKNLEQAERRNLGNSTGGAYKGAGSFQFSWAGHKAIGLAHIQPV